MSLAELELIKQWSFWTAITLACSSPIPNVSRITLWKSRRLRQSRCTYHALATPSGLVLTLMYNSMLYNFPAVTSGIDLDHALVQRIAERAPNTCGIKLTCANVGKLTRLGAATRSKAFDAHYPRKVPQAP